MCVPKTIDAMRILCEYLDEDKMEYNSSSNRLAMLEIRYNTFGPNKKFADL